MRRESGPRDEGHLEEENQDLEGKDALRRKSTSKVKTSRGEINSSETRAPQRGVQLEGKGRLEERISSLRGESAPQ